METAVITEPALSVRRTRLIALIVATALFMQNLDSTIVATALPAMAKTFHADPLHMSVTLTAYLISLSVFIPASSWVADRFGSRNVFRAAIVVFTLGSIACGLAPTLWFLVIARIIQGMGGAMMLPVGRLLVLRSVSKAQMVSATSWLTVPALLGPVLGPPIGGFMVTYFSWRWVFDINVPIGLIGVSLVTIFIKDVREPDAVYKPDTLGLALTGFAMAALMGGLETIGKGLVPASWTVGLLALGLLALFIYYRHQRNHHYPALDFTLFKVQTFWISAVSGTFFRIAIGALPYLMPLMLQLGFGYSALQSGLVTFASAAGSMVMKPAAQPVLRRFGFRNTLLANGAISVVFMMICAAFRPGWPSLVMTILLLIGGFFRSLQFTAFNTIAYGDIPRTRMSAATSLYTTAQQLTLTLGIVVSAAVLDFATQLNHHATATISDYSISFVIISLISACGMPILMLLSKTAGEEVSGHHVARKT